MYYQNVNHSFGNWENLVAGNALCSVTFFYHTVPKYFKRIDRQKICLRQNILNRDCMELKRFHNCKNGCSLWQKYQRSVSLKEYIPSSFKWRHTYLIYLSIYYFTFRPIQLARKSLRSNKQGKEYNRFFLVGSFPSLRSQLCQLLEQRNTFYVRDTLSPREMLLIPMDWNDHHSISIYSSCAALENPPHFSYPIV